MTLLIAASAGTKKRVGQWVDAGEVVGRAPGLQDDVRAPVSGVVTRVAPRDGGTMTLVVERRREYEEMDH